MTWQYHTHTLPSGGEGEFLPRLISNSIRSESHSNLTQPNPAQPSPIQFDVILSSLVSSLDLSCAILSFSTLPPHHHHDHTRLPLSLTHTHSLSLLSVSLRERESEAPHAKPPAAAHCPTGSPIPFYTERQPQTAQHFPLSAFCNA